MFLTNVYHFCYYANKNVRKSQNGKRSPDNNNLIVFFVNKYQTPLYIGLSRHTRSVICLAMNTIIIPHFFSFEIYLITTLGIGYNFIAFILSSFFLRHLSLFVEVSVVAEKRAHCIFFIERFTGSIANSHTF